MFFSVRVTLGHYNEKRSNTSLAMQSHIVSIDAVCV